MLVDRHCFILLHLICYGSPHGGAISLVPLWFPLVVFVVLDSLLGVPIALFFGQGTPAWRDAYA